MRDGDTRKSVKDLGRLWRESSFRIELWRSVVGCLGDVMDRVYADVFERRAINLRFNVNACNGLAKVSYIRDRQLV